MKNQKSEGGVIFIGYHLSVQVLFQTIASRSMDNEWNYRRSTASILLLKAVPKYMLSIHIQQQHAIQVETKCPNLEHNSNGFKVTWIIFTWLKNKCIATCNCNREHLQNRGTVTHRKLVLSFSTNHTNKRKKKQLRD